MPTPTKYKIGDVVKIINVGCHYPTYSEMYHKFWPNGNHKGSRTARLSDYGDDLIINEYRISGIDNSAITDRVLYGLDHVTGVVVIGEDGIELVRSVPAIIEDTEAVPNIILHKRWVTI